MIASQFLGSRAAAAALAVALLAWGGAGRASADAFQVTYESRGAGIITDVQYNGNDVATFVGQYNMRVVGGSAFVSFCVDPADTMHPGLTYLVQPRSTSDGLTAGGQIAYLYNTYGRSPLTDPHEAAGLQLALWELVIDGSMGNSDVAATRLSTGNFRYDGSLPNFDATAYGDALFFLNQAAVNIGEATWLDSSPGAVLGPKGQGVLLPPPGPAEGVPEPASVLLLGLGLAGAATYRRLRRLRR